MINDGQRPATPVGTKVVLDLSGYPNGCCPERTRFSLRTAYPKGIVSGGATDNGNGVDVVGIPSEAQFVSLTDGVTVTETRRG